MNIFKAAREKHTWPQNKEGPKADFSRGTWKPGGSGTVSVKHRNNKRNPVNPESYPVKMTRGTGKTLLSPADWHYKKCWRKPFTEKEDEGGNVRVHKKNEEHRIPSTHKEWKLHMRYVRKLKVSSKHLWKVTDYLNKNYNYIVFIIYILYT